jgi:hypothetical protein
MEKLKMQRFPILFALSCSLLPSAFAGSIVRLDTSVLNPSQAWYLDFQLANGDGLAGNNTAGINLLSVDCGTKPVGDILESAIGSCPSYLITDSSSPGAALIPFTPGNLLRFELSNTASFSGNFFPDTFSFAVLDQNFVPIVSSGLGASLVILADGSGPQTFAADAQFNFVTPTFESPASGVPEPALSGLVVLFLATAIGYHRARRD